MERSLRVSVDSLLEGMQVIGFDWTYRYLNPAAARHGQREVDDLLGRTMMSAYPGIENTPVFAVLQRVMLSRRAERLRNEFTYPTGESRWFDLVVEPVPDGICVLSMDVTVEHLAADERRQDDERNRFALRAARMGIWQYRPVTGDVYWSETFEEIAGVEPGQGPRTLDGFLAFIDPADAPGVRDAVRAAIGGASDRIAVEFRLMRPDEQVRWIEGHGRLAADPAGRGRMLVGVGIDITTRRTLETQLQLAQKMEALGQLAGGIAHDFNNLLTQILGYCDLAGDALTGDPRVSDIDEIRRAGQQAATLTRDLLAFSRQQVPETRVLDLNEVISGTARMIARVLGEHVEVRLQLDPSLGAIRADEGHVSRLLMNLVANARDAMPDGGTLTIETSNVELDETYSATHLEAAPGRYVQLAVTDTGIGMAADVQARLFEPFFTTKEVGRGTGLGLASVHGIVKQAGGSIYVYSEPGRGTTFKIYLPRSDDRPEAAGAEPEPAPASHATILVVEDNPALCALASRILEQDGHTVLVAASAAEALQAVGARDGAIDLLLADVVMPGQSGPALADELRRRRPDLAVIHMSGYTGDTVLRHGVDDGRAWFIQKPFTPRVLVRKVHEVLAKTRSRRT